MIRALLAVLLVLLLGPAARAERLIVSVSNHRVTVTPNYSGEELVLFGSVEKDANTPPNRSYDLVVAPYADDFGSGFAHVRRAAAAIGGRRLIALTLGDRERVLPANTFRWHTKTAETPPRVSSTR